MSMMHRVVLICVVAALAGSSLVAQDEGKKPVELTYRVALSYDKAAKTFVPKYGSDGEPIMIKPGDRVSVRLVEPNPPTRARRLQQWQVTYTWTDRQKKGKDTIIRNHKVDVPLNKDVSLDREVNLTFVVGTDAEEKRHRIMNGEAKDFAEPFRRASTISVVCSVNHDAPPLSAFPKPDPRAVPTAGDPKQVPDNGPAPGVWYVLEVKIERPPATHR
jgi:hypothetical protein